ncbi:hypothetical protein K501DRAFT_279943 [Backusella circina FSU 941]|nr:hypothetical protein K501DRAFT_279943 [Backusella circina FSU 941]
MIYYSKAKETLGHDIIDQYKTDFLSIESTAERMEEGDLEEVTDDQKEICTRCINGLAKIASIFMDMIVSGDILYFVEELLEQDKNVVINGLDPEVVSTPVLCSSDTQNLFESINRFQSLV